MKKLKLLIPMVLVMMFAAGCGESSNESANVDIQDYSLENPGKTINISNDKLEFQMDADTTQFSVKNKENGQIWYSNPQDADADTLANGANKDMLYSTLNVQYSNAKGESLSYNNYTYSIKEKRYSIEETKDEAGNVNGVKVLYSVGDVKKTYIVPDAISEERMNEFCSKMSAADSKKIKNFYRRIDIDNLRVTDDKDSLLAEYPDLADTKVYVLRNKEKQSNAKFEMFEETFKSGGYNADELEYDNSRINVDNGTGKAVFNIPVYYTIDGGELVVNVPMNEIVYDKDKFPITYLTTLPFFGAANNKEEGYMFVPDGPGGKINFNNGKVGQAAYKNQVYGADLGISRDAVVDESEVSYPLIGIAKDGGSCLCAIEEGSSYAIVEADVAGRINNYNSVKFTYTMTHGEDMDISGKSDVTIRNYEDGLPDENLKQRYMFLTSDNYVDMASSYRDYITRTYPTIAADTSESKPDSSLVVEMVGCVDGKKHILGIPVTRDLALTEYDDATDITSELVDSGIKNLVVKYSGWSNHGIHNSTMSSVKLSGVLGSKGDLEDFIQNAKDKNVDVYMDSNFQFVFKNKLFDSFIINRDSCKFASREIVELSAYNPIYFAEMPDEYQYYLARPAYAMDNVDSVSEYLKDDLEGGNISFADMSTELSGDYNYKKRVSREKTMNMITDKYKELEKNGTKVMTNSDFFYNVPDSDIMTGMVLNTKKFNIVDESIPFYQIALHGIVNYTAESMNLSQDAKETFLKSAELGANLYYTITKEPASTLQDSKYTEYFATDYSLWKDTIIEDYKRFANDFNGTYNQYITGHEKLADNVYKTQFGNGVEVIVNYNYNDFSYNGTNVPARDYIVEGGAN